MRVRMNALALGLCLALAAGCTSNSQKTDASQHPPASEEAASAQFSTPDTVRGPRGPAGILSQAKSQTELAALRLKLADAMVREDAAATLKLMGPGVLLPKPGSSGWVTLDTLLSSGYRILPDGTAVFPAMWDGRPESHRLILAFTRAEGWQAKELNVQ